MNAIEAIMTRRSTRKFKSEAPSKEAIDAVVEAGRFAPSGGNSQSVHFFVVTNGDVLNELRTQVQRSFAAMEETPGMYKSMANSIRLSKTGNYVYDYGTPVLIIVANQKDYGNNMADCACALENMMIAANEFNLGSCWINQLRWLNEDEVILSKMYALGMDESERVYGALALGIPDTDNEMPNREALKRTGNKVTCID